MKYMKMILMNNDNEIIMRWNENENGEWKQWRNNENNDNEEK